MKGILVKIFVFFLLTNNVYSIPSDTIIKRKFGALPYGFYSPETRLGVGAFIYSHFYTNKFDSLNRKSNTQTFFSYTLNKQFSIENDYQIWLNNNNYFLTGSIDYSRYPEYFFGIGNNNSVNDKLMISFDIIRIQLKNLRKINTNLYFGFEYQYQKLYNQNIDVNSAKMSELLPGGMGYTASGFGPILIYDGRDNPLNPANGAYLETSLQYFDQFLNSKYKFTSFILDARKYNTFFGKLIWNGNAYLFFNNGDVPFRMMATMGGARFMRGYMKGRYRDNNMYVLQHEFRLPLYKWFGVAMFSGVGSVANSLSEFSNNKVHVNGGVGLRIRINEKENTNLRIDYGFTRDSRGLYLVFAEAF